MMRKFGILAVTLCASLAANFQNHLKPVPDKSGNHSMRNIDFIYVINLDQRPEKLAHCIQELAPYDIVPCRFSAVNGWELSMEAINELGIRCTADMEKGKWASWYALDGNRSTQHELFGQEGRNYFSHCLALGPIGCALSHLSVLQDAYDSGYETIWVMEDDIEVIRDPHLLSFYIEELDNLVGKENWDILYTDPETKNADGNPVPCTAYAWRPDFTPPNPSKFQERDNISRDFRRLGARYGTYSMIIRRSGIEKILNFYKAHPIFLPYDLDIIFSEGIQFYNLRNEVVSTQPRAASDNGAPNYANKADLLR